MPASSTTITDNSTLRRIDWLLFTLETALVFFSGLVILALILLATTNVLGRWLFNTPISGYVDIIEQAMAFFAILCVSYAQRQGSHIRLDIIISHLRGRILWLVECLSTLLMLLLMIILTYGAYLHFLRAYQIGDSSLDIELPTWPAKLVVPVAFAVLSARLLIQLIGYVQAMISNAEYPVAVPLKEDAKAQAKHEVDKAILTTNG